MDSQAHATVLLVAPAPPPEYGGIITWTRIVINALRSRSDITLYLVDSMQRWRGFLDLSLLSRAVFGSVKALDDIRKIVLHLVRVRPNVLHLCSSAGLATLKDIVILAACKLFSTPSILHYHMGRIPALALAGGVRWWLMRQAMSLADTVIVLDTRSQEVIRSLFPGKRVFHIPNMVEIDAVDNILSEGQKERLLSHEGIEILYLGNVHSSKGVKELVEACAEIRKPSIVLRIVGPAEPVFKEELLRISRADHGGGSWLQLEESVSHERAIQYIGRCDIFVLPSHSEGAPNVLLEAMACSRPILSTTVGAIPEMLDWKGSEECGICVEPGNVPELRAAVTRLAMDETLRARIASNARSRVKRLFAAQICIERLVSLWLDQPRRTNPVVPSPCGCDQELPHVQLPREEGANVDLLPHSNGQ